MRVKALRLGELTTVERLRALRHEPVTRWATVRRWWARVRRIAIRGERQA